MSEYRSTPDGKTTKSTARYLKEWRNLKTPIESALDLVCIGFDPGLLMQPKGGGTPIDMPIWFAKRLSECLRNKDIQLRK